jgi:hypothetical protein
VKIERRGRGCNSCGIYRVLRRGRISGEVGFAGGERRSGELWGKVGRRKRYSKIYWIYERWRLVFPELLVRERLNLPVEELRRNLRRRLAWVVSALSSLVGGGFSPLTLTEERWKIFSSHVTFIFMQNSFI